MKTISFLFICFTLVGCAPGNFFSYETRPPLGIPSVISNDTLKISAVLSKDEIGIDVKNNWSNPFKIIWDDAAIVIAGRSSKIVHNGVQYGDFEKPMGPTIVPPGAVYSDQVVQPDNIFPFGDSWLHRGVLPKFDGGKAERTQYNLSLQKDSLLLYLPISIGGDEHFYRFSWLIDSVSMRETQMGDTH